MVGALLLVFTLTPSLHPDLTPGASACPLGCVVNVLSWFGVHKAGRRTEESPSCREIDYGTQGVNTSAPSLPWMPLKRRFSFVFQSFLSEFNLQQPPLLTVLTTQLWGSFPPHSLCGLSVTTSQNTPYSSPHCRVRFQERLKGRSPERLSDSPQVTQPHSG